MLEDEFNARMQELYLSGKREGKYSAPVFAQLLKDQGGLETARRFIHSSDYAAGFTKLWERERLDLTVEAVILDEPKWHPLFTAEEIETCRNACVTMATPPNSTCDSYRGRRFRLLRQVLHFDEAAT